MTKLLSVSACLVLTASAPFTFAQEIDENALFGDTAIAMIDSATLVASSATLAGTDSTSVSFSGNISSIAEPSLSRDFFTSHSRSDAAVNALMLGSFMLDVRLPFGMKSFINAESFIRPGNEFAFSIPELFLDANYKHKVYVRAGKQVLQWGRGYFWNPTDLVNVEKKTFISKVGAREGTFGIKAHVPFGTRFNIYSFLDMNDLASVDSLAGALRGEALFGGTEVGISIWEKPLRDPIFGMDISKTVFSWSFTGEMSLTSGKNYHILDLDKSFSRQEVNPESPFVFSSPDQDIVTRLSISAMRSFDFLDVDDRVMAIAEFYYNQIGDNGNVFKKYRLGEHLAMLNDLPDTSSIRKTANSALQSAFEFNSLARYYSAFFITISKFIVQDMSLQVNSLVNYNHHCAILTGGVQYATMHNFSLGCLLTGYVGPKESEYTFMNSGASVRLTAGVQF
jgi:hypothetical protein